VLDGKVLTFSASLPFLTTNSDKSPPQKAWNSAQNTANVLFAEYANTNAAGNRIGFAKKNTAAVGIGSILSNYASWVDSAYLGLGA